MDAIQALKKRMSCRFFTDEQIRGIISLCESI